MQQKLSIPNLLNTMKVNHAKLIEYNQINTKERVSIHNRPVTCSARLNNYLPKGLEFPVDDCSLNSNVEDVFGIF